MSQLEHLLQERLAVATSELSIVQEELNKVQFKVDSLTRQVDAFTRALAEERGEGSPAISESPEDSPGSTDNKSQMVRDLVSANAQIGTTIKDIKVAFAKSGVSFHPNYPYSLVRRLKRGGTIKELRGKLYPVKTETAS